MDGTSDVGVDRAALLSEFADSVIACHGAALDTSRKQLSAAIGEAGMIDAAAVIAGFNGICRIADATGIPLEPPKAEHTAGLRADLGIDRFLEAKS